MGNYDLIKMQKKLKKYQDPERFQHTISVMYTASSMAMRYGADLEKALVAGLLHDCAKCIPNEKKYKLCKKNHITLSQAEQDNPFLLHAKLGVFIAKEKYDVEDEDILNAIRYHTTGTTNMTLLEKIIYIADYIEPFRNKAPNLDVVRKLAFEDIDETLYTILKDSLQYLQHTGNEIDPMTRNAYEFYHEKMEKRRTTI